MIKTWKDSHGKERTITVEDLDQRANELEAEGNLLMARVFRNSVHVHRDAERRDNLRKLARGFLRMLRP